MKIATKIDSKGLQEKKIETGASPRKKIETGGLPRKKWNQRLSVKTKSSFWPRNLGKKNILCEIKIKSFGGTLRKKVETGGSPRKKIETGGLQRKKMIRRLMIDPLKA